jgi:alginate O-acetyltransferase complex protein AlgI
MLFPTIEFASFFSVVFVVGWSLARRPRAWKLFAIAASYVFYGWWDWRFVLLLGASTVANQVGAIGATTAPTPAMRRAVAGATIAADLALLGWFKYYGFAALNVDAVLAGLGLPALVPLIQITLPVGISFFTFMGISYVVDVYRGIIRPAGWLDFATYLSFFPHLVAGPIVRGSELLPQLAAPREPKRIEFPRAAVLIVGGLFKKVVLSTFLAGAIVDPVFALPGTHSTLEIVAAIYAYAIQIYADFSGYTDIAIGVALLLGYRFPDNFAAPYTARSLQDFWRRWHITLSRWLKDYVYIPLGGSRHGTAATVRNLVVTMLLGGLWHGAAWTFIAWGAFHGVGQAIEHVWRGARIARGQTPLPDGRVAAVLERAITFQVVCMGWVLFRAHSLDDVMALTSRALSAPGPSPLVTPLVIGAIALGIVTQYLSGSPWRATVSAFARLHPLAQATALGSAMAGITALAPDGIPPFIYYRF